MAVLKDMARVGSSGEGGKVGDSRSYIVPESGGNNNNSGAFNGEKEQIGEETN